MSTTNEGLVTTPAVEIDPVIELTETDAVSPEVAPEVIDINDNEVGVEAPENTELKYVGDLVKLAVVGDKDALIRRASEIEAGFEKLHRDREFVQSTLSQAQSFANALDKIAEGEQTAVQEFVDMLWEKGIDPEVLLGVKARPVAPVVENDKLTQLEQKLQAMEQEKKDAQWINANADKLLNAIKPLSSLEYKPEHLLKARAFLPKQGQVTPQNLLVAIHQANPELTVGLVTRQPKQATPQMGTSSGASGSNFSGSDLAKLTGDDLRRWYLQNKGSL
jgi:hypothetical protein